MIVVPASKSNPAKVLFDVDDALIVSENTSDEVLDLNTKGKSGVETVPAVAPAIYYVYAVPKLEEKPESGFELICSLNPPAEPKDEMKVKTVEKISIGLEKFEHWSYLGAFLTRQWDDEVQIIGISSSGGRAFLNGHAESVSTQTFGENNPVKLMIPNMLQRCMVNSAFRIFKTLGIELLSRRKEEVMVSHP